MDDELAQRKTKFEQWLVRENDLAASTAKGYAGYIGPYLQHAGRLTTTSDDAEAFREHQLDRWQDDEISANTVRNSLFSVERYQEMMDDPVELKKPSKPKSMPKFLTMDEAQELLFACQKVRDYAIINVLLYGGLRASEVCNLDVDDWDREERSLTVRDGKSGKDRMVVISEKANHAIKRWIMERGADEGPLFTSCNGNRLRYEAITRTVKKWAREAGLEKNVTAHMLRHTLATHAIREGMAVTDVQAQLGHADPKTTMIYTHVVNEGRKEAYDDGVPGF